jgi:hypothetical protein
MTILRTDDNRITFAVHDVVPATEPIQLYKTRDVLDELLRVTTERSKSEQEKLIYCSGYNSDSISAKYHPLFWAVHWAFSQHRPLVLSPDMIWITIVQGLSQHVRNNSEALRHKFVEHSGKMELQVTRGEILEGSPENAWDEVVADFSALLEGKLGEKYETLMANFSTTGPAERTVCQIALMDVFQPYFTYSLKCICGIPSITLEGSPSDWLALRNKVESLVDYELEWWMKDLRIILDEFHQAANGNYNRSFWQNIYKQTSRYGASIINGWISRLIPYLKHWSSGNYNVLNPEIGKPFPVLDLTESKENDREGVVTTDLIPSGISQVPVKVSFVQSGRKQLMLFMEGFIGIEQDKQTLALRPKLGWAIFESGKRDQMLCDLPSDCTLVPPAEMTELDEKMRALSDQSFGVCVPDDLIRFYKECNGLQFKDASAIKFVPVQQLKTEFCFATRVMSEVEFLSSQEPSIAESKQAGAKSSTSEQGTVMQWADKLSEFFGMKKEDITAEVEATMLQMSDWLKFAEMPDGIYFALELRNTGSEDLDLQNMEMMQRFEALSNCRSRYKVWKVNPHANKAIKVADSFAEFVLKTIDCHGKPV